MNLLEQRDHLAKRVYKWRPRVEHWRKQLLDSGTQINHLVPIRRRVFHLAERGEQFKSDAIRLGMPKPFIEDIQGYLQICQMITIAIGKLIGGRAYIAIDLSDNDLWEAEMCKVAIENRRMEAGDEGEA